jgi:fatty acid desaturase
MKDSEKYNRTKLDTELLRSLHQRSDVQGALRVIGHLASIGLTGWIFFMCTNRGWWPASLLALLLHGTLFGFLGYAGASHEFSHHTVFKKKAVNVLFLRLFSFLVWGNHAYFFRTHTIHHRNTLDPDIDTEVPSTKCIALFNLVVTSTFDVRRLFRTIRMQWLNACGIIPGRAGVLVLPPENTSARHQVAIAARVIILGHLSLAAIFIVTGYWQLVWLVNLAAFIGNGLPNLLASAQHCGMKVETGDYRENTRTVLLNPVISFFYWNMNYHVEHHMYPGVPCYNLPNLHKLITPELPPATKGIVGILKAIKIARTNGGIGDCSMPGV